MHIYLQVMIAAWIFVAIWISGVIFTQKKHHPSALFYLFFTELWERFSYYGMRALLIFYMTQQLLFSDKMSYGVYGSYVALVYASPVLGGLISDKFLGSRKSIFLGAILMAIGHFAMAFEEQVMFFTALGFLIIGNGFFKPNISTLVGKLYTQGDPKKDSAFTLFYMGINTGAFLTPLTCGTVGKLYGDQYGFALAGIGMVIGLIIFTVGNRLGHYKDQGLPPNPELISKPVFAGLSIKTLIYIGAFAVVPIFATLVNFNDVSSIILYFAIGGMFLYLLYKSMHEDKVQRERLFVILVLFIFTTIFWTFFELAGSVISLFTDRNVNLSTSFSKDPIPPSIFQSVNPLFIILLAPLFSLFWEYLSKRNRDISDPVKFSLGLLQLGIGFGFLVFGAKQAGPDGLTPLIFLILAYFFHTTGELCLSPIGLSLVTKLSPAKIVAFVMGFWFLSSSLAGILGAEIGKLASIPESAPGAKVSAMETLPVYAGVFEWISYTSIIAAIILFTLTPILKKWMHGIK